MKKIEIITQIKELKEAKKKCYTDIRFVDGRIYQLNQLLKEKK